MQQDSSPDKPGLVKLQLAEMTARCFPRALTLAWLSSALLVRGEALVLRGCCDLETNGTGRNYCCGAVCRGSLERGTHLLASEPEVGQWCRHREQVVAAMCCARPRWGPLAPGIVALELTTIRKPTEWALPPRHDMLQATAVPPRVLFTVFTMVSYLASSPKTCRPRSTTVRWPGCRRAAVVRRAFSTGVLHMRVLASARLHRPQSTVGCHNSREWQCELPLSHCHLGTRTRE